MICWMGRRSAPWHRPLAAAAALAGVLSVLADVRAASSQTPYGLYRERTAMLAVGARCRLFDASLTTALGAGQIQARTAALRAGADPQSLDRGAADVGTWAAGLPCASPRVQQSAQRARDAYRAYSGLQRMSFPGDIGIWRADRAMPLKSAAWRLAQDAFAGQDKVVFGLAGQEGVQALTLSVASIDGATPYAAQILLRDPARAPQPYLPAPGAPLSARAPLRAAARAIMAEAKAPADPALRPLGAGSAVAFRFPADAQAALQGLDPREAISVELLYPSAGGDIVRTAFLEVGDFNAGLAFLSLGPR